MTMSLKENSYLKTTAVALVPIGLGSAASYFLTFRCCDGVAMVPAPGLGYLRWDITVAIWMACAVCMTLVTLLVTLFTKLIRKPSWSISVLVLRTTLYQFG